MPDKNIDISGIGEIAKAIPKKSWNRIVTTACETFEKCLSPITELTSGTGRLIAAKFDRLVDMEKVLAAETMRAAYEKVEKSNRIPAGNYKADVLVRSIELAGGQTDVNLRELWANLIAQEILDGSVHPEVVSILSRLSAQDAQALATIASRSPSANRIQSFVKIMGSALPGGGISSIGFAMIKRPNISFSEKLLETLNLIEQHNNIWMLTPIGEGFINAVSDPDSDHNV